MPGLEIPGECLLEAKLSKGEPVQLRLPKSTPEQADHGLHLDQSRERFYIRLTPAEDRSR